MKALRAGATRPERRFRGFGTRTAPGLLAAWAVLLATAGITSCSWGAGPATPADRARVQPQPVTVLTVDNPQMTDLARLTAQDFTPRTGIEVRFEALRENELRARVDETLRSGRPGYDVVSLGSYNLQVYSALGLLAPLTAVYRETAFDADDLLPPIRAINQGADGRPYGVPFYGESSMLMYNEDAVRAAGLTVPARPTWSQVADLAARLDRSQPGMRGICLRGLPGWGQMMSPLLTVVNTFGGTLFHEDWSSGISDPEFTRAVHFYLDLLRAHGEDGAPQAGYTECLNAMSRGRVALWYDATAAAGLLEDPTTSRIAGKVGFAAAPVERTESSGWLHSWAWCIPAARASGPRAEQAARFITWAGSPEYVQLAGRELGWHRVPDGTRASTYRDPQYRAATSRWSGEAYRAIMSVDPAAPGLQPRPYVGVQYVPIPEFAGFAMDFSLQLNAALAGTDRLADVLRTADEAAQAVGAARRRSAG